MKDHSIDVNYYHYIIIKIESVYFIIRSKQMFYIDEHLMMLIIII